MVAAAQSVGPRPANISTEDGAVIRCPECSTEIDVDEDEVEEGEILSCPECEAELEVVAIPCCWRLLKTWKRSSLLSR